MIPIKKARDIEKMRKVCEAAATVLQRMGEELKPGVTTYDLDQCGRQAMAELGVTSACYNYRNGRHLFPAYTCISVNEEVVHGIGTLRRSIQPGDVVSLDVVVELDGYIGDNAKTMIVGTADPKVEDMVNVTRDSLMHAIQFAREGNRVGDISHAVQSYVEPRGYSIVRDFVGHGVGQSMHEEPQIPNYGRKGKGAKLKAGMTLAIEPMVNLGRPEVRVTSDGWTAVTVDRQPSAHFEHTVLVTRGDPEILTLAKK